jgi:hypothetical protein
MSRCCYSHNHAVVCEALQCGPAHAKSKHLSLPKTPQVDPHSKAVVCLMQMQCDLPCSTLYCSTLCGSTPRSHSGPLLLTQSCCGVPRGAGTALAHSQRHSGSLPWGPLWESWAWGAAQSHQTWGRWPVAGHSLVVKKFFGTRPRRGHGHQGAEGWSTGGASKWQRQLAVQEGYQDAGHTLAATQTDTYRHTATSAGGSVVSRM